MTTTTRSYYACSYPYGVAADANTGRLIRTFYRFDSAAERDQWVDDAPTSYRSNRGYREATLARDPDLRRALASEFAAYEVIDASEVS